MLSPLKLLGLIAGCILTYQCAEAQKTEPLTLKLSKEKVTGSLYNKISVIDLRPDTSGLGMVQEGMLNRQVKIVAQEPLQVQLNNILKSLNDDSAKPGELIIQLRQLAFSELTSSFSEHGYFGFGATLYAKKDSLYIPIQSIDTLAVVSAMDVTKKNIQNGSEIITKFLTDALHKTPDENKGYHYDELVNFANVTKKKLKLYTSNTYADGFYSTYKSFSNQVPDGQFSLNGKEIKAGNIKVVDEKGRLKKLKPETIYAIVYNGKPFIATPLSFYPIYKFNNDFFFTGKLSNLKNISSMAAMGTMYGALGGALFGALAASSGSNSNPTFKVKIYCLTGDFIRLKEIKDIKTPGRNED